MRLFGLRRRSLTVGPLMSCKAWARLVSPSRSHSQASSRAGWPKVFEERVIDLAVGQLHRARAERHAGELLRPSVT